MRIGRVALGTLALGAATPVASTGLIATMVTAIREVHLDTAPFIQKHGYEHDLVLIAALLALVAAVAGSFLAEAASDRLARSVPA